MRLSSLSAVYFLDASPDNIYVKQKKTLIHLNKLEDVLVTKSVVLHHFPHPYKNDDVDTCKRTGGGTFKDKRSGFKFPLPPPPHSHTQNDDVNTRYESEEVPLTIAHF